MTDKSSFTQDELFVLWKAPYSVALAIISAQPGGLAAEMLASIKAAVEARDIYKSELVQSILTLEQSEAESFGEKVSSEAQGRGQVTSTDILEMAIKDIRLAVALLRDRAEPVEVEEYKQMVEQRLLKVANAASEGGFLGIGGVRISDAEQRVIDELRLALNRAH